MRGNKRRFLAMLKRIYKEDREPEVEKLRCELKKRRIEFYTREDNKKTLVLVHHASWRRGKSSQHGWPIYFKTWGDDEKNCHETFILWSEELEKYSKASVDALKDFVTDEEEEDVPYIQ